MTTHPILGQVAPVESLGLATLEAINSSGGCSIPKMLADINARALELPAFGQWLPIESAPKDGTPLMVWVAEDDAVGTHCLAPISITNDGWWWDDSTGDQIRRILSATHWMPLPPPPAKDSP